MPLHKYNATFPNPIQQFWTRAIQLVQFRLGKACLSAQNLISYGKQTYANGNK